MADPTPQAASTTPSTTGVPGAQAGQLDEVTKRLLTRLMQPKSQVQPAPGADKPPTMMAPTGGIAHNQDEGRQMFVHNLFALIHNAGAAEKAKQLKHATGVLSSLNNSWSKAQELSGGDQEKAKQLFSQMPEVTHILEDKKNVKQLGKLLQFDFMEPEKKKTVWHEALGNVVKAGEQLPFIKQLTGLIQKHKENQQTPVTAPDYAKQEQEASATAKQFAGQARPDPAQQAEISKVLPSLVSAQGADLRAREREMFQDYERQQKQNFSASIDAVKNPVDKANMKAFQAMQSGDTDKANEYLDQAHKLSTAKSTHGQQLTVPALVNQSVNDPDPEKRAAADAALKKIWGEQEKQLSMRGASFGMSRPAQYVNSETGETDILNGFQVQNRIKAGEHWQMIGNLPPDTVLSMQQIARSAQPAVKAVESHLKAYDNSQDQAIIARVLRTNPAVHGMDEGTLSNWIDQSLTGKLSPDGQTLMQDVKVLAEVMGRMRKLTGQSSSEMNTELLLGLLPSEKTPNSKYGAQQLERAKNYIDGMVQAPILGGGRFQSAKSPKPAEKADTPPRPKGVPEGAHWNKETRTWSM